MKTKQFFFSSALISGVCLSFFASSIAAEAAAVSVQIVASAGNATAGESGATVASSALIDVLVLGVDGKPVPNLYTIVGNQNSVITLPAGWTLTTFNAPAGGCGLAPTQFIQGANGINLMHVVPHVGNPACRWLSGDYIFSIRFSTSTRDGSALGKLTIR